jgi:phenylacetic acid degradation operon negative regulatory protein
MPPDAYHQTKAALLSLGGQRVWSLMATLFGDLAQAQGSTIDGPVLSAVMAEMDVRPEAVRVALYRLRNDGWIVSEKHGRTGRHALSPDSRIATKKASARIYASPATPDENWQLVLTQVAMTEDTVRMHGFAELVPRVYLGCGDIQSPAQALSFKGLEAPEWLRTQLAEIMLEEEYGALLPHLTAAHHTLEEGALTPLETAVIRCLLVHNWRRIILRHPAMPRTILPADWAGHQCHVLIDALLARFPRPAIEDISPS